MREGERGGREGGWKEGERGGERGSIIKLHVSELTRSLHSSVVIRVNTYFLVSEGECILAGIDCLQLVMALERGPSPKTVAIHDMREPLTIQDLQTTVR